MTIPVLILEMETSGSPDSLRGIVFTTSCDGVKKEMKLNESVWRTAFLELDPPPSLKTREMRGEMPLRSDLQAQGPEQHTRQHTTSQMSTDSKWKLILSSRFSLT